MEGEDINQVPVTKGGQFVGMLTRDHILRVLYANLELGAHEEHAFSAGATRTEPD